MSPDAHNPLIPRAGDERVVASAWERFVRHEAVEVSALRPVVLASWRRSRSVAVDPAHACAPTLATSRMQELQRANRELCDAAAPVIAELRDVLRECASLIMICDAAGTVLQLHGEPRLRRAGERINLAQGGLWNEGVIGTNAIGTAVATRKPVQIYADEHFCIDVKAWTCAAAPIVDPHSGHLLGVLDVSGVKESFHGHSLGLAMAAARQIEVELARRSAEIRTQLLCCAVDLFDKYPGDGLVLFDHRGRVVKTHGNLQAARQSHGLTQDFHQGEQIEGLDLASHEAGFAPPAPRGIGPEWLHPVRHRDERLGSLLVIPLRHSRPVSRDEPGVAPGDAARTAARVPERDAFAGVIGGSEIMRAVIARARRVAQLDLPVLLLGETGSGKELFARAIHRAGKKARAPFIAVNCGALPRDLLASELFGYADGAFTGARRGGLPGKFEQADGGTLFLDEIGEMPLDMQTHLLRVLQENVVVRLGDNKERAIDVRVVAATHRSLGDDVGHGRFREDLYHRLCVLPIELPALRQRREDIEPILEQINSQLAAKYRCRTKVLAPALLEALRAYDWPGNIRELRNVFEAMFALCEADVLDASQLPPSLMRAAQAQPAAPRAELGGSLQLDLLQRQAVLAAIERAGGNLSKAARALGIARSTLYVKLAQIHGNRATSSA